MKNTLTIVCTGYSLRGFDFEKIKTDIYACNQAKFFVPTYKKLITWDERSEKRTWIDVNKVDSITIHGGKWIAEGETLNREKGKVGYMNNTLLFAINVAIQKGYKKIFVLGADGKIDNYLHFWDDEPVSGFIRENYERIFEQVAIKLKSIKNELLPDEEIIFVDSAYKIFPMISKEEYLKIQNNYYEQI